MAKEQLLYESWIVHEKKLNSKLNPYHINICKVYPRVQDDLVINITTKIIKIIYHIKKYRMKKWVHPRG